MCRWKGVWRKSWYSLPYNTYSGFMYTAVPLFFSDLNYGATTGAYASVMTI